MENEQLDFLSEEPLANPSASPDSEKDWLTRAVTWPSRFLDMLTAHGPNGWFGRTSPGSFPVGQMRRRILRPMDAEYIAKKFAALEESLDPKAMNSQQKSALERLRKLTKPQTLTVSSPGFQNSGIVSPTECLTLNTSESPRDAVASSLSDILETGDLPPRFYLSKTACVGILRRAARRGKAAEECPDGPRYKAVGNSMAVVVMRWLGGRIKAVEDILK